MLNLGDIVTHSDLFHRRGASTGAIEAITEQGWYQVWWEDSENQIHPAARTFEFSELKLRDEEYHKGTDCRQK